MTFGMCDMYHTSQGLDAVQPELTVQDLLDFMLKGKGIVLSTSTSNCATFQTGEQEEIITGIKRKAEIDINEFNNSSPTKRKKELIDEEILQIYPTVAPADKFYNVLFSHCDKQSFDEAFTITSSKVSKTNKVIQANHISSGEIGFAASNFLKCINEDIHVAIIPKQSFIRLKSVTITLQNNLLYSISAYTYLARKEVAFVLKRTSAKLKDLSEEKRRIKIIITTEYELHSKHTIVSKSYKLLVCGRDYARTNCPTWAGKNKRS